MYNSEVIQNEGKHDFDKDNSLAESGWNKTFSVGIFKWELKSNGKSLKKGKTIVRVSGRVEDKEIVFQMAQDIVMQLDCGTWNGRKTVKVS